jgi:vesicular inhibitory amino acid transporter
MKKDMENTGSDKLNKNQLGSTISYGSIESGENESTGLLSLLPDTVVKCTNFETAMNIVKVIAGSGMLSLPFAAKSMGWSAVGVLLILGCIFLYSFQLLAEAIDIYRRKYANQIESNHFIVDYIALSKAGLGQFGEKLVLTTFSVELLLALTSFLINIGLNIHYVIPKLSVSFGIIMAALVSFFLSLFGLNIAAIASALGLGLTFFIILSLLWSGLAADISADEKKYEVLNTQGIPISLGLIAFCFGGHATL